MKDFEIGCSFIDGIISLEISRIAIRFYIQQMTDGITKTIPMDLTLEELHELHNMIAHAASTAQGMYHPFEVEAE